MDVDPLTRQQLVVQRLLEQRVTKRVVLFGVGLDQLLCNRFPKLLAQLRVVAIRDGGEEVVRNGPACRSRDAEKFLRRV